MPRRTYSLEGRLGNVYARGAKLKGDVAEAVTSAALSLSASEVTQLTITVADDPKLTLLRSGLFTPGTPSKRGSHLAYRNLNLEVRALEVGPLGDGALLTVTARSAGAMALRRRKGPLVRKDLSPTQFAALEAKAVGLKFVGEQTAKRKAIARKTGKEAESSWDTLQRLAEEVGYYCFEVAGTLYFARPTYLVKTQERVRVAWKRGRTDDALDELPTCRRSGDDKAKVAQIDAKLRGDLGDQALPGMALVLDNVPSFAGRYLITGVNLNLAEGEAASVSAVTAENPEPQPPEKASKSGGSSSSSGASSGDDAAGGPKSAARFVAIALEQAGDTYIYGAEASVSDPNPSAFDCSELVQWAAGRAGVPFVDGSSAQIAACRAISVDQAIRTRGALLWHPGHIAISLGNGRTIEAANSRVGVVSYSAAGRFQRGGLIPGLRY